MVVRGLEDIVYCSCSKGLGFCIISEQELASLCVQLDCVVHSLVFVGMQLDLYFL